MPFGLGSSLLADVASKRYSLDPLLKYREQLVDRHAEDVARRAREASDATMSLLRERKTLEEHRSQVATTAASEQTRVETGDARVSDLAHLHGWALAQRAISQSLQTKVDRAQAATRSAEQRETKARAELSTARANADAVKHHKQEHLQSVRKLQEAQQDEQAEDVFLSRLIRERS